MEKDLKPLSDFSNISQQKGEKISGNPLMEQPEKVQ